MSSSESTCIRQIRTSLGTSKVHDIHPLGESWYLTEKLHTVERYSADAQTLLAGIMSLDEMFSEWQFEEDLWPSLQRPVVDMRKQQMLDRRWLIITTKIGHMTVSLITDQRLKFVESRPRRPVIVQAPYSYAKFVLHISFLFRIIPQAAISSKVVLQA